jgi:DNA-binding XRE family transcriptional regulator
MKINAELIVKLRKERFWSQDELAKASGLHLRTIQRIEKEGSASLHSKKVLAAALDINILDLNDKEMKMKTCPECNSNKIYQYKEEIESGGGYGPDLLPKAASGMFSIAKLLPVVCVECGYIRLFASEESRKKLETSKHWVQV